MEKINIKADTTSSRFIAAAVSKSDNAALRKSVHGKLIAVVTFQINGIDVPFEATLEQMSREYVQAVERLSLDKAEALVMGAGLGEVLAQFTKARLAVRLALQTVREKAPDGKVVETAEPA